MKKFHKTTHSIERISQRFRSNAEAEAHFQEALVELKKKRIHARKGNMNIVGGKQVQSYILEYKGATFVFNRMGGYNLLITAYKWYTRGEEAVRVKLGIQT